jgi:hypothetical protein
MRNEHGSVSYAHFSLMRPQIASLLLVYAFIAFVCDTFQRYACLPVCRLANARSCYLVCLSGCQSAFHIACLYICLLI